MILHRIFYRVFSRDLRISTSIFINRTIFKELPTNYYMTADHVKYLTTNKQSKRTEIKAQFIEDGTRMPIRQRLKHMVTLYGPIATVLHITLSLTFLGITYLVVKFGFDTTGFLQSGNYFSESYMKILATGGTFGLAYALYKTMMPLRVMVTVLLTPKVATKLQSIGLIKKRF